MKSYTVTHEDAPENSGPYALEVAFLRHGGINRVVASQIRAIRKAHTPEYLIAWLRQRGYDVQDLSVTIVLPMVKK